VITFENCQSKKFRQDWILKQIEQSSEELAIKFGELYDPDIQEIIRGEHM